jgi:nicotinate-nucleotide adenylyltransferase
MRIGLFGGSFDPVHRGHLLVAQAAREELGLDRLVFIPAALSPFKSGRVLASDGLRLQMLRLALAGRAWCAVDDQEVQRGGVSYTIQTAQSYRARYPGAELCWLIGADHLATLPLWKSAGELAAMLEFVVIPRPAAGGEPQVAPAGFRVRTLRGVPFAVSSSVVRERVRAGLPVDWLVPEAVAEALRNNGLYL